MTGVEQYCAINSTKSSPFPLYNNIQNTFTETYIEYGITVQHNFSLSILENSQMSILLHSHTDESNVLETHTALFVPTRNPLVVPKQQIIAIYIMTG